jgi:hypothetical protein
MRTEPARVAANAGRRHARRDGDAGAAARGARNARAVVGVARGAEARVVVGDADGEFMQVGLAEHDRARADELRRHRRVLLRPMLLQGRRAARRRHRGCVDIVLEDDRQALERAGLARFTPLVRLGGGGLGGGRIEMDEGVERSEAPAALGERGRELGRRDLALAHRGKRGSRGQLYEVHAVEPPFGLVIAPCNSRPRNLR